MPDGYYAVPVESGNCRLLWLKTVVGELGHKDKGMFGKRILYYRINEKKWCAFAFLSDNGEMQIHKKFLHSWSPEQLAGIRSVFAAINRAPEEARQLYEQVK